MGKSRNQRQERFLVLWVGGSRKSAHRTTVESVLKRNNTKLVVLLTGLGCHLGNLARKLQCTLVSLSSRVGEEDLGGVKISRSTGALDQLLGQFAGGDVVIEVAEMDDLLGLIKEDPGDLRIGVSEGVDGDTGGEVEVLAVSDVVEIRALAVSEGNGRATVSSEGVFGVFFDNVLCLRVCINIGVTQLARRGIIIYISHLMETEIGKQRNANNER